MKYRVIGGHRSVDRGCWSSVKFLIYSPEIASLSWGQMKIQDSTQISKGSKVWLGEVGLEVEERQKPSILLVCSLQMWRKLWRQVCRPLILIEEYVT